MKARRVDGVRSQPPGADHSLVAIGNFDGVHRGHRAVLARACEDARTRGLRLVVLTFHPHPAEVLGRGRQAVLTPLDRKVELLCRQDAALSVVVEPFTQALAAMSPAEFAGELLVRGLSARVVVVGQNFRFGQGRRGDLGVLSELGRTLGFEARAEPLSVDDGGPISSSRVRAALAAGELPLAERLLGRPHALSGTVVKGDGRGRTLGVPTANLDGVEEALPPFGVYACLVDRLDESGRARTLGTGVLNVGNRPTVGAGFSVEVHLHGVDVDLYGARLRAHLVTALRPEQKFAGLPELVAQIRRDIAASREATEGRAPDPLAEGAWC